MRADEVPTAAIAGTGENVESGFEPVIEALSNFDRLVPRVIGGNRTVVSLFQSPRCKVIVQLDHCHTAWDRFRSVDLNFVVLLGVSQRGKQKDGSAGENYLGCGFSCQRRLSARVIEKARAFYNNPGLQRQCKATTVWSAATCRRF